MFQHFLYVNNCRTFVSKQHEPDFPKKFFPQICDIGITEAESNSGWREWEGGVLPAPRPRCLVASPLLTEQTPGCLGT